MHPLLHLIATRPRLLAEHAEAYAELVSAELPHISAAWQRRMLLNALAFIGLGIGLVLAGVAVMLWCVAAPAPVMQAPWALFVVPAVPLLISLACVLAARSRQPGEAMHNLRQQFNADVELLRRAAAQS